MQKSQVVILGVVAAIIGIIVLGGILKNSNDSGGCGCAFIAALIILGLIAYLRISGTILN